MLLVTLVLLVLAAHFLLVLYLFVTLVLLVLAALFLLVLHLLQLSFQTVGPSICPPGSPLEGHLRLLQSRLQYVLFFGLKKSETGTG